MNQVARTVITGGLAALTTLAIAQGGSRGARNPFSPPNAKLQYAPNRTYDLQNLVLEFDVDYPNRSVEAVATNTVSALLDGTTKWHFDTGVAIRIESATFDGKPVNYAKDDEGILVETSPVSAAGKHNFVFHYHFRKADTQNGNGGGGWHWHEPSKSDPSKTGFFTNGETSDTRDWAVTWDYPNDFTTTETRTTVPADWQVISNGLQVSDTPSADRKRHTVVWRLNEGHATYLTSLVAGPFDIHHDRWRGMPLYYVAPKGMGSKLDYSFAHTKDILSFYSDKLGVRYPWPKYAQDITYDFGGGQENVSATTYGTFLTEPREGRYDMDSLIAHETGHQWFGDYVTCKDWGQIWLNESFATFMEMSFMRQSEGMNYSLREIEQNSQGYFDESRRYKRPLATNYYANPGVMFDQHTYPKGGVLLMSLRSLIGEQAFYAGLHRYLTLHHNSPVESNDLCEALTDASGINLHPWFDQWIYKPGHPVLDWSWSWDATTHEVVVHVKQTQDTAAGTPIYDIPAKVGLIRMNSGTHLEEAPIHLSKADDTFRIASAEKPDAVVLDPNHEFLREIRREPWSTAELLPVLQYDPNPIDRAATLSRLLGANPSAADVQAILAILRRDTGAQPGIINTSGLESLTGVDLSDFWMAELSHENYQRRTTAVQALGRMPKESGRMARLRSMVDDKQPYNVVGAALTGLARLDFAGNRDLIIGEAKNSTRGTLRRSALIALADANDPAALELVLAAAQETQPTDIRAAGIAAIAQLKVTDPRMVQPIRAALSSGDFGLTFSAITAASSKKFKELIPDLEALKSRMPFMADRVDAAISEIKA